MLCSGRRGRTRHTGGVLDVRGAAKGYAGEALFDDVTLTVPAGAAVAVVGPNGSGKSTFLRCVLGLEPLDRGAVELAGRPLDERDPGVRADVATALDEPATFPDLSVQEHLDLLACAHGVPDVVSTVDSALDELGLRGAADQFPVTLSSGQRRRLALAACLVRPRRLLVLDEPEQRLDTAGRRWLARWLGREKAAGVAVLFACHDDDLVDAVADDVLRVGA
jgi:ABC-2 type transport system ATP-binding protein